MKHDGFLGVIILIVMALLMFTWWTSHQRLCAIEKSIHLESKAICD